MIESSLLLILGEGEEGVEDFRSWFPHCLHQLSEEAFSVLHCEQILELLEEEVELEEDVVTGFGFGAGVGAGFSCSKYLLRNILAFPFATSYAS